MKREPLFPHVPKRKEALFPHRPKGQPGTPSSCYEYSVNIPVTYRQAQTSAGRCYIRERLSEVRRRILSRCPDAKIKSGFVIGHLHVKCANPLSAKDLGRSIEVTSWPSTKRKLPTLLPAVTSPYTADQIFTRAKDLFGTTTSPNEAGYILPDGTMLDFSGRHYEPSAPISGPFRERMADHREIAFAWPEDDSPGGFGAMAQVMKWGAIRFSTFHETVVVNLVKPPTEPQIKAIKRVLGYNPDAVLVVEVDSPFLDQIDYREFTYPFTNWRAFVERTVMVA